MPGNADHGIDQFCPEFREGTRAASPSPIMLLRPNRRMPSLAFGAAGLALWPVESVALGEGSRLGRQGRICGIEDAISIRHRPAAFLAPEFGVLRESTPPGSLFYGRAGLLLCQGLITHAIDAQGAFQSALDDFAAAATSGVNRQTEARFWPGGSVAGRCGY